MRILDLQICAALLVLPITTQVVEANPKKKGKSKNKVEIQLNEQGTKAVKYYQGRLDKLRKELSSKIPDINDALKNQYSISKKKKNNEGPTIDLARKILKGVEGTLADESLDLKLMQCAVLAHATAQKIGTSIQADASGYAHLNNLLKNPELLRQVLLAGGAQNGSYIQAMKIYKNIVDHKKGNLSELMQRLAMAISLEFAAPETNRLSGIDPLKRFEYYETAYLAGKLERHFKEHSIFLLRQVVNDEHSNEDLVWLREMLENYRPDFINYPENYKHPIVGLMTSEFGHKRPEFDTSKKTSRLQQSIDRGGQCGPKAFFGRALGRAYGLPVWGARLRSHTAMTHWTPRGWEQILGVSWNNGFWVNNQPNKMKAWYFQLDALARNHPKEYMKISKARWIGAALKEETVDGMLPDQSGGLWNSLAYQLSKITVLAHYKLDDKKKPKWMLNSSIKDSPKCPGKLAKHIIREKDRIVTLAPDGTFLLPAAGTQHPVENTDKILFMNSIGDDGMQLHYKRWKQPEPIIYEFDAPSSGNYAFSMKVCTVNREQFFNVTTNESNKAIKIELPYTVGAWGDSSPITLTLKKGKNKIQLNRSVPENFDKEGYKFAGSEFGGISLKTLMLKPIR